METDSEVRATLAVTENLIKSENEDPVATRTDATVYSPNTEIKQALSKKLQDLLSQM